MRTQFEQLTSDTSFLEEFENLSARGEPLDWSFERERREDCLRTPEEILETLPKEFLQ